MKVSRRFRAELLRLTVKVEEYGIFKAIPKPHFSTFGDELSGMVKVGLK